MFRSLLAGMTLSRLYVIAAKPNSSSDIRAHTLFTAPGGEPAATNYPEHKPSKFLLEGNGQSFHLLPLAVIRGLLKTYFPTAIGTVGYPKLIPPG